MSAPPIDDADRREQLRVPDQEEERLAARQLVDRERMPPDDAVGSVAGRQERQQRDGAEDF